MLSTEDSSIEIIMEVLSTEDGSSINIVTLCEYKFKEVKLLTVTK